MARTDSVHGARPAEDGTAAGEAPQLRLLGGFELRAGSRRIDVSPRAQEVLALLALRSSLYRSQVAGTIWPTMTEERALGSLRTTLWRLNQQLPGCVLCDGRRMRLSATTTVDVDQFVRRGRQLLDPARTVPPEDVCGPWPDPWQTGDLLPGWEHEWLVIDRERLRQLRLHACEAAVKRLCDLGQHSLAVEYALGLIREEPTRESAYRTLITVYLAEGNHVEARRTYAQCAVMLQRELGTAPTFSLDLTCTPPRCGARGPGRPRSARPPARVGTARGS